MIDENRYLYKRKAFEYENELRILYENGAIFEHKEANTAEPILTGYQVKVKLPILIDKIFVNPEAPEWFFDLVQSVTKRYGHNFQVTTSRLSEEPIF